MNYNELTLEELEELDRNPPVFEEEEQYFSYRDRALLYKAMFHKVRKLVRNKEEDQSYLDDIQKRLVAYLIRYGTYMKLAGEQNDHVAIASLHEALSYDRKNIIAPYRLGFLYYRRSSHQEAISYFQLAITNHNRFGEEGEGLSERQLINARLYLMNSALYIAQKEKEALSSLPEEMLETLPGYAFSDFCPILSTNEGYLAEHAFYRETVQGKVTCSKKQCNEIFSEQPKDTLVLYFSDTHLKLAFNDEQASLSKREADLLRHLFSRSSKEKPATINSVRNYFELEFADDEVKWENYRKAIQLLRRKLSGNYMPCPISNSPGRHAYYYDGSYPFVLLYRVDQDFQ